MDEDPRLTPIFHEVFDLLNRREEVRKQVGALSTQAKEGGGNTSGHEPKAAFDDLRQTEIELLNAIASLADNVESVLAKDCSPAGYMQVARDCKPFQACRHLVNSSQDRSDELIGILRKCDENGSVGAIAEVIFAKPFEGRTIPQFGLALDLLQHWELILRTQTNIPCEAFCRGLRKTLSPRIKKLLVFETVLQMMPRSEDASSSPLIDVLTKDITDRLGRIAVRLEQIEQIQYALRERQLDEFTNVLKRQRVLFGDEMATVLSELVHLSDNARKLLTTCHQDPRQLDFVEELQCYRAAACYVNTRKHGIRGRNKSSAVAEFEIVAESKGRIATVDQIINFKGDGWQATEIIDDLLQLWEMFIRHCTTIEFREFRRCLGSRVSSKAALFTYQCKLRKDIDNYMELKANERMRYNV